MLDKAVKDKLIAGFCKHFGMPENARFFSAPGRTEICGNHTDHQGGCAIAAAVDAETVAIAAPNGENVIRIKSLGHNINCVELDRLFPIESEIDRSNSIVRGVCFAMRDMGFEPIGFNAYTLSAVPVGGGLSSSAAYEVLVGGIISHYAGKEATPALLAHAGFVAETQFYKKPCGLLDQSAVAYGGCVFMDFANKITEKQSFNPEKFGYRLIVTNTGTSHSDLSHEYAAIKEEMSAVAGFFGKSVLSAVSPDAFYGKIPALREALGDRAVLRAIHYFEENLRVANALECMKNDDFEGFLSAISKSGRSSFMYLQNVYADKKNQALSLALAVSERVLGEKGAFRVHGGGFAGTVQAYVPFEKEEQYICQMESIFGKGCCMPLQIRPHGFAVLEKL